ncbi:VaFE repeat-containing surface-anchored protein [Leifsonia sp. F6_8S_P_1B]|uniref:VaFE repeat-containing surface-anchored protein n=1 Tax=Leifsonia williamsii TaxID=3035919 RepID=A0ABT8KCI6_9MICO|nr:VaFE repeat-containing surface-anchored protein [Leifsonia williamsii]MDN4614722.1 VaFE repeat-containing surface-anchored protein [Leifsonia williamsii]
MNVNDVGRSGRASAPAAARRPRANLLPVGWLRRSLGMALACGIVLGGGTVTEQMLAPVPAAEAATSVSGVVNSYQAVSAVSGNAVTVTGGVTGAGTPFAVGDRVLLIQMTGVSPEVPGSNFGNFDATTITAISGSTITLAAIARSYSPASEKVQLVRTYTDGGTTTVSGDVKAKAWDGITGGVASLAGQSLQLNANIDASGTGFTTDKPPTTQIVGARSSGQGQTSGRGFNGANFSGEYLDDLEDAKFTGSAGVGGGGQTGGGGAASKSGRGGVGGGIAGGADSGIDGVYTKAAGVDGGRASGDPKELWDKGALGGAGGGGGVVGGGGGGGAAASGGGGGSDGGGSAASVLVEYSSNRYGSVTTQRSGGGGGGVRSVGNGGDGLAGSSKGNEGAAGGGGGSYGGGGGVADNYVGAGGGGGGSWFGGSAGAPGGGPTEFGPKQPAGGNGNTAIGASIPDDRHYLNATNPRLMMGGAGGRGSSEQGLTLGGAGGGIIVLAFDSVSAASNKQIKSNGSDGVAPPGGGSHSGSGGGAGGQMKISVGSLNTKVTMSALGGVGGAATGNYDHGGVPGGGGGGGGVWLETSTASSTCPATNVPNATFALSGGSGGSQMADPKTGGLAGAAGTGGIGLPCVSKLKLPPTLSTVAVDKADGDHVLTQSGGTVVDTLTYSNLTPGVTYTATGTLWDKATAKATPITASKTFTADASGNGTVAVEFTVPSGYGGASLVAFEKILDAANAVVVSHEDLADAAQTVSIADLATVAVDKSDGDHTLTASGGTIQDTLSYTNLAPNTSYTVNGTLWDKATTTATSITATKTFTASSTGTGTVVVEFTVPSGFGGKTLVAYERVLSGATLVASHESISDSNQTVTLQTKPLIVNKVDETGRLIDGATFGLCQEVLAQIICTGLPDFSRTAAGVFSIATLPAGTYQLKETKAPDGYYALANPVRFSVAGDGTLTLLSTDPDVTLSDQTITVKDEAMPVDIVKVGSDGTTNVPLNGAAFLAFPFSGLDAQARVVVPDTVTPVSGVWYRVNPANVAAYQKVQSAHSGWTLTFTADAAVPAGTVRLSGLVAGTQYALVEMVAPTGHALLAEPVQFSVDAGKTITVTQAGFHPEAVAKNNQLTITDPASIILPFTGTGAPWQYGAAGIVLLILVAAAVLLVRRRNGNQQTPTEQAPATH